MFIILQIFYATRAVFGGCINNSLHLARKYARIFVRGHYLFRESKEKYPSIFSPQMETIVIIILQIFYATRAVLKIGGYAGNIDLNEKNLLDFW